jgi:hypothetical protein
VWKWYVRYRLSFAEVAEWLAERGVQVDPATIYHWVQRFTPLYQDVARRFRRPVGRIWSVDETVLHVAGRLQYAYRAIDEYGQVVDNGRVSTYLFYDPPLSGFPLSLSRNAAGQPTLVLGTGPTQYTFVRKRGQRS